jgi:biotin carboxylase
VWPSEVAGHETVEAARQAADALGIGNGPTYTQIRIGPEGPRVIEVAARLGGGHDAELCLLALSVDLNGLAIRAALGERAVPSDIRPRVAGAVVRFLVAPPGELATVDVGEAATGIASVVRIYRRPGHRFGELRTGADRAGAVITLGASRDEALALAEKAADSIRFETVDAALSEA